MTIKSSGALGFDEINAEFGRGTNLNAYRGTQWFTDLAGAGTFNTDNISFSEFYSKRVSAPYSYWEGNVTFTRPSPFISQAGSAANRTLFPSGRTSTTIFVSGPNVTFACDGSPARTFVGFNDGGGRPGSSCYLLISGVFSGFSTDWVACGLAYRFQFTDWTAVLNTTRFVRIEVYP